jgi:hypothetical protein
MCAQLAGPDLAAAFWNASQTPGIRDRKTAKLNRACKDPVILASELRERPQRLDNLAGSIVYPDWNSVDPDMEPANAFDSSAIRIVERTYWPTVTRNRSKRQRH